MLIQRFDQNKLNKEYGILCQRLYPLPEIPGREAKLDLPFGSTYCEIEVGGTTSPHHHYEGETFYILAGSGSMRIEEEEASVHEGDVVFIPPFKNHTLVNTSQTTLRFISVYWEVQPRLSDGAPPQRALVYSAPPTPNGDLHLGHLSGPYLAADILQRFLKLGGIDARSVCGSDDNQSYVPVKGLKLGVSSEEVVRKYVPSIQSTFAKANIEHHGFLQPYKNQAYEKFVQDFFLKLVESNKLKLKTTQVYFCQKCEIHLHEARIRGLCPNCALPTNGNGCEGCGHTNDCINLLEPRCNICSEKPVFKNIKKYVFPLNEYKQKLDDHLSKVPMPSNVRRYVLKMIEEGLPEVSATHPETWGISVPPMLRNSLEGEPGQVIYEWIEMAAGYLFLAQGQSPHENFSHFWKSEKADVYLCFGFDNSFFYLTLIPALLMAYDEAIKLPVAYIVNEFYLLDHSKFSTSRNHAIWAKDFLNIVPEDMVRFYLSYSRPENIQTNFSLEEMKAVVTLDLVKPFDSLLDEANQIFFEIKSFSLFEKWPSSIMSPDLTSFVNYANATLIDVYNCYRPESFSPQTAIRRISQYVVRIRKLNETMKALKDCPSHEKHWVAYTTVLSAAFKALGTMSLPIMPRWSTNLLRRFGVQNPNWESNLKAFSRTENLPSEKFKIDEFSKGALDLERFNKLQKKREHDQNPSL